MSTSEAPGTAARAVRELHTIAHGWVDGRRLDPALLVDAALRALIAGIDTPSVLHLAALGRSEHDLAPDLFDRVMAELGFGFHPPEDYWEGRLALARWWATEIVGGWLDPLEGVSLIFHDVAEAYGRCEELNPVIDAVMGSPGSDARGSAHVVTADLTQVARQVVARVPPPVR